MALTADAALKLLEGQLTAPAGDAPAPAAQPAATTTTNSSRTASQALEALGSVIPAPTGPTEAPGAPQQQRPSTLAESALAPVAAVGSAVGTMLRRPFLDTANPQTRAQLGERPGVRFDMTGSDPRAATFMDRMKE